LNFTEKILNWYDDNKRDLPWRKDDDPYRIWLSEVIMQQTQIIQGTSYYLRFIEQFPTVFDLAKADEHDVLMLWQGLGYYSRARYLHQTARIIVDRFNGIFPGNYEEIISLKGIGDYTASMILSVCFNQPSAAVDGNISRLISRFYGVHEPVNKGEGFNQIKKIVSNSIPKDRPGDFNQASMEFGALHCTPKKPDCETCIFREGCHAFIKDLVRVLPVKEKPKPKQKAYWYYLFCKDPEGLIYIKKREEGIWMGLYEFPLLISEKKLKDSLIFERLCIIDETDGFKVSGCSKEIIHMLSHRELHIKFFRIDLQKRNFDFLKKYIPVSTKLSGNYPFPIVIKNFLENLSLNNPI
jgi:A/G-specific adenine glycosylase